MSVVRATFHATYPPYVAGDVAGLGRAMAERLRQRGIVSFEEPALALADLDRAALVALARERLGVIDTPPDDVSDDDLRAALQGALGGAAKAGSEDVAAGWDRLDVMDRAHLEAFARDKCRMTEIDADLTDADLRDQIRAVAASTLSVAATATKPEQVASRKRRP